MSASASQPRVMEPGPRLALTLTVRGLEDPAPESALRQTTVTARRATILAPAGR